MNIRKIDHKFPTNLTVGEKFADDINKVYPIDTPENVELSAIALASEDFVQYEDKEKYLVISRINDEAKEFGIADKVKTHIEKYNGGDMVKNEELKNLVLEAVKSVSADKDSDEKNRLEEFVGELFAGVQDSETVTELKNQIEGKSTEIEALTKDKETLEADLKQVNEDKVALEKSVIARDRAIELAQQFDAIEMDAEAKRSKIVNILKVSEAYDDENFKTYVDEEIAFIKSFAKASVDPEVDPEVDPKDDLVEASADVPNPNPKPDEKDEKYLKTCANFIKHSSIKR